MVMEYCVRGIKNFKRPPKQMINAFCRTALIRSSRMFGSSSNSIINGALLGAIHGAKISGIRDAFLRVQPFVNV